jgi:hypothetical protein
LTGHTTLHMRKFQETYLNWLENGVRGTQVFPEAWKT